MNNELAQMQTQLDRLSNELSDARRNIRKMETRSSWRPNALSLTCFALVFALGIVSFGAKASSGDAPKAPSAFSADVPTKVKAPFEVVDDQGRTILRVMDQTPNGEIDRGAYVLNETGKRIVDLTSTSDGGGGGRIKVTAAGSETTSDLSQATGVTIDGNRQSSGMQIVRQGKKVASIGAEGDKLAEKGTKLAESGGLIQVYGSNERPTITLSSGKDGGQLNVFDAKNKQAATLASDTGGGALKMFNAGSDKPKAVFSSETDGGSLKIYGTSEKPVATLQSDAGDGKLWIGNKAGKTVAGVFANNDGGVVKVMRDGDPDTYTSMSAITIGIGLAVRIAGVRKSYVGTNPEGNGAVFVYSHSDDPVAGLTTYNSGHGVVSVYNNSTPIAFLAESDKNPGGGSVTATDPAGNGIFSAGFTGDGGDVCVDRKKTLKCLGAGLPLQIN